MDGGTLVLDPEQVWVDAWALEAMCDEPPAQEKAILKARIAAIERLSRGSFLADQDAPWVFTARDRLRSKLTRMLQRYAAAMQDCEQWLLLSHLYQKLIDADPVNEALHRGLIQGYRTQGMDGDALTAYRRCRELMQRLLGREPPATTRALVGDLL
jgi:DNA-binding SARP family transcriptional activator